MDKRTIDFFALDCIEVVLETIMYNISFKNKCTPFKGLAI